MLVCLLHGLGCRVSGLGFRVWGSGFRVSGPGALDATVGSKRYRKIVCLGF